MVHDLRSLFRAAALNCDLTRLHLLWELTHKIHTQKTRVERSALYFDIFGEVEGPSEGTTGNPLVDEIFILFFGLPSLNRERVLLRGDGNFVRLKPG